MKIAAIWGDLLEYLWEREEKLSREEQWEESSRNTYAA